MDRLYQSKCLRSSQADSAKCQYDDLLQSVCVIHKEKFSSFDCKSDRVDKFLGHFIKKDKSFSDLWTVYVFVFVLAHGQSQTECGFNINKVMLVENLEKTSIKGQQQLYDYMASKNVTIHKFIIPKELTLSCKSAYSKYKAAMKSARAETISESHEMKQKIFIDKIANVKCSKLTLESCVTTLCKDADALSLECENRLDPVELIKLVTKSNSFRKTAIEKEMAISELKQAMTKLENDLKNL